jgi:photosystem II stability/assembly factor-like uncharacterized protein
MTLIAGASTELSIHISSNGGATWESKSLPDQVNWSEEKIAISADGSKITLATGEEDALFLRSSDGGDSWTTYSMSGVFASRAISSSADGMKLAATVTKAPNADAILTSTDGGQTWEEQTAAGPVAWWSHIASSSDGLKLIASREAGYLSISVDGGTTWTSQVSAGAKDWYRVASSSDGLTLYAYGRLNGTNDAVYRSLNGGATWQRFVRGAMWGLTSSGDGTILFGRRTAPRGGQLLYSSAVDTFDGIRGEGELKLIYLGSGVFGRMS